MNSDEKLRLLRAQMQAEGVDGYVVTGADPHHSEYTAARWETRRWITGFTGSAGIAAVTRSAAALWVDPRYHLQAGKELAGTSWTLFPVSLPGENLVISWLAEQLEPGDTLGCNAWETSAASWEIYREGLNPRGIRTRLTGDLLDLVWQGRPPLPREPVTEVPAAYTGCTRTEKLDRVRSRMDEAGADWFILSSLDDIAWLLNLRGNDVPYNRLFLAYLFAGRERMVLAAGVKGAVKELLLHEEIEVVPYEDAPGRLEQLLSEEPGTVLFDERTTSMGIAGRIGEKNPVIKAADMTASWKAKKNSAELQGMQEAHLQDGAAMTAFLCWLEHSWKEGTWDEWSLGQKLFEFRREREGFIHESFSPIFGFRENGAVVHYSAKQGHAALIDRRGLMIIDSGGQYLGGTTDITRTVLFGDAKPEEIRDYTLVLKGHIKLASQLFPEGTRGMQLDTLARMFLWDAGKQYGHGTGHGVGHMLCVHEGPVSISPKLVDVPVEAGMVCSDEPGIYYEGKYGIRIENLLYAEGAGDWGFGPFLRWQPLTLCPYERRLIDPSLLSGEEKACIDSYHRRVYEALADHITKEEARWLKEKTRPVQ